MQKIIQFKSYCPHTHHRPIALPGVTIKIVGKRLWRRYGVLTK